MVRPSCNKNGELKKHLKWKNGGDLFLSSSINKIR